MIPPPSLRERERGEQRRGERRCLLVGGATGRNSRLGAAEMETRMKRPTTSGEGKTLEMMARKEEEEEEEEEMVSERMIVG